MPDFGTDLACTTDLDPGLSLVSGDEALRQSLARSLITPKGSLWWAPTRGVDVREWLRGKWAPGDDKRHAAEIEHEFLADERVESVTAAVTLDGTGKVVRIRASGTASSGPFELVASVTDAAGLVIAGA